MSRNIGAEIAGDNEDGIGIYDNFYCSEMNQTDSNSMNKALKYHVEYLNRLSKDLAISETLAFKTFCELSDVSFKLKG